MVEMVHDDDDDGDDDKDDVDVEEVELRAAGDIGIYLWARLMFASSSRSNIPRYPGLELGHSPQQSLY